MTALQQFWYSQAAIGPAVTADTAGDTVTVSAATDTATAWLWDWGDGTTSTGRAPPAHTYSTPYPHTITLTTTYTSADGCRQYQSVTRTTVEGSTLPVCAETIVMVEQHQTFGGASVGDGMAQSGPAVTARTNFLAALASHVSDNLNGRTPSTSVKYNLTNPLPLCGGLASLAALQADDEELFITGTRSVLVSPAISTGNGRFNATENASGLWYESDGTFDITLTESRTAFGCYVMDVGDFGATVTFEFYNGSTLRRTVAVPTANPDRPSSNEAMWVGYANGNTPFDRVRVVITQVGARPDQYDVIGFDGFAFGQVSPCTPV